ncbi:ankyrin [Piromyces finnis]|uniref:Ankyrin n=1 Tax=Piromyces finnis TaxID=1754191 RepID=A0A1Y1UYC5_9FUNG|nr:ankyrin [Piromyces finnis]|eukprot:ORX42273.1 ankyrin [Piromyces finnis]
MNDNINNNDLDNNNNNSANNNSAGNKPKNNKLNNSSNKNKLNKISNDIKPNKISDDSKLNIIPKDNKLNNYSNKDNSNNNNLNNNNSNNNDSNKDNSNNNNLNNNNSNNNDPNKDNSNNNNLNNNNSNNNDPNKDNSNKDDLNDDDNDDDNENVNEVEKSHFEKDYNKELNHIIEKNIMIKYEELEDIFENGGYIDSKYFNKEYISNIANNKSLIQYFSKKGIPIHNKKEDRKYTIIYPLIFSVKQNYMDFIRELLKCNPSIIDEMDSEHKVPIVYAFDNYNTEIVNLFINQYKYDVNKVFDSKKGLTPLIYTVENNNSKMFNYLFSAMKKDTKEKTIHSIITYSLNNKKFDIIDFMDKNKNTQYLKIYSKMNTILSNPHSKIDLSGENENGHTIYHYSCLKGNKELIHCLLNNGYTFNIENKGKDSPLMLSIINKNYQCSKYLLKNDQSFDINYRNNKKEMALTLLLRNRDSSKELIEMLYKREAYLTEHDFKNKSLIKLMIESNNLLDLFIKYGIRIKTNAQDIKLEKTPIIFAVKIKDKNLLIALLKRSGANPNELDKNNKSPLYYAIKQNNVEFIRILLNFNGDINQKIMGKTCLIYTIEKNNMAIFSEIIKNKTIKNNKYSLIYSIFSFAYRLKDYKILKFLTDQEELLNENDFPTYKLLEQIVGLNEFQDINENVDEKGRNLLHYTCSIGNEKLLGILFNEKLKFDINKPCRDGSTPLILSIKEGHFECAAEIIEKGANVNQCDQNKKTPIMYILEKNDKNETENIMLNLLNHGSYIPIKYFKDHAYTKYIIKNIKLMKRIAYEGVDLIDEDEEVLKIKYPLIFFVKENYLSFATELIKYGAVIDQKDDSGRNALDYAIINKNIDIIKKLLDNNIKFNQLALLKTCIGKNNPSIFTLLLEYIIIKENKIKLNEYLQTIIQESIKTSNKTSIEFLNTHLRKKYYNAYNTLHDILIKMDNNEDIQNQMPLHNACKIGKLNLFEKLSKNKNINCNQKDNEGSTPLICLVKNKHVDGVKPFFGYFKNVDVNLTDNHNKTAIEYLLDYDHKDIELYILFMKRGAYFNYNMIKNNKSFKTILLESESFVHYIIHNGINYYNDDDETVVPVQKNLVRFSVYHQFHSLLAALIKNGVEVHSKDIKRILKENNKKVFGILMEYIHRDKQQEIVEIIFSGAFKSKNCDTLWNMMDYFKDVEDQNAKILLGDIKENINLYINGNYEPLHQACFNSNFKCISSLQHYKYDGNTRSNSNGETALITSIKNCKYNCVIYLLNSFDIDVTIPDKNGITPLIQMIINKQTKEMKTECIEIFKVLIHHTDLSMEYQGESLLQLSIKHMKNDYAKIIMNRLGLKIDGEDGKEILSYMIDNKIENEEIYEYLFNKGAYMEFKYVFNSVSVILIEENPVLVKYFANHGMRIESRGKIQHIKTPVIHFINGNKRIITERLLNANNKLAEEIDEEGFTPLFRCIEKNNHSIFFKLLNDYHVDINKTNEMGETPLKYAKRIKAHQIMISYLEKCHNSKNDDSYASNHSSNSNRSEIRRNNNKSLSENAKLITRKSINQEDIKNIYSINSYLDSGKLTKNNDDNSDDSLLIYTIEEDDNEEIDYGSDISDTSGSEYGFNYRNITSDIDIEKNNIFSIVNEAEDVSDIDKNDIFLSVNEVEDEFEFEDNNENEDEDKSEDEFEFEKEEKYVYNNRIVENEEEKENYKCDVSSDNIEEYETMSILSKDNDTDSTNDDDENKDDNRVDIITNDENDDDISLTELLRNPSTQNNEKLKLWIERHDPYGVYPPENLTILEYSINYKNKECFKYYVNKISNDEKNILLLNEIKNYNDDDLINEFIKILLLNGADANLVDPSNQKSLLIYATEKNSINLVKQLIEFNADINYKTPQGLTSMKAAIKNNNINIFKLFIPKK